MAKPAEVLFQTGGTGAILFAGQVVPAAAIRADALKRLHELARQAMQRAKSGDTGTDEFRIALQDLHLELATLLLNLQDAGRRHGAELPDELRVGSGDFVYFDDARQPGVAAVAAGPARLNARTLDRRRHQEEGCG